MNRLTILLLCSWAVLRPGVGEAQVQGFDITKAWRTERIGENHWRLVGAAEIAGSDWAFYADQVELFLDSDRLVATGNVVFSSGGNRVAADRVEFNPKTRTGTFYQATGSASLGERVDRSMFGTQEPDAYFYGETIEKLGPRRYRITKGGFTTCVQPTPRWELTSTSVILNLDDYAILKNSFFKVKGVPVFYLPMLYYPIKEDDRATGFLIPTYGGSTVKGQIISNAFFWAINRSQDATFLHDWFSKTGQGGGVEYRYVLGPGSEGSARTYVINQHETTFATDDGGQQVVSSVPGVRSYELRAAATQVLPGRLRARMNVDYFSDITVHQTYHQNIYDASQRSRTYSANLSGSRGAFSFNGLFDWRETFFGSTSSSLYGGAPRVSFNRAPRKVGGSPIYFSVGGEYARLLREDRSNDQVIRDQGLSRLDLTPQIRLPFTRWPFLTVNSNVSWRNTYYTESLNPRGVQVSDPLYRRYVSLRSEVIGPVFTRVWNTPENGYAEKFKHVVEPTVSFERVTSIDNRNRIVLLEGTDYAIGGSTRINYGLTNRFLAKGHEGAGTRSREFLGVTVNQSYYTDARASQFDYFYSTSFGARKPSKFSTVAIGVRASPTDRTVLDLRLEYDPQTRDFESLSATGRMPLGSRLETSAGLSERRSFNGVDKDRFLSSGTTVKARGNRLGGTYTFNYDVSRRTFLQQRVVGYYNAQCCGFAVEYQTYNFPRFDPRFPVPQDRRFNFSFTLAGIGTFSNIFGAFGGTPR